MNASPSSQQGQHPRFALTPQMSNEVRNHGPARPGPSVIVFSLRPSKVAVVTALFVLVGAGCSKSRNVLPNLTTPDAGWVLADFGQGRCISVNTSGQLVGVDAQSTRRLSLCRTEPGCP